jgi:hypothetical protein
MDTHHGLMAFGVALALSGCAALNADKEPLQITAKSDVATSPVVREALPQPAQPPAPATGTATTTPASAAASVPSQPKAAAKPATRSTAPTLANVAPTLSAPPAAPPVAAPSSIPPGTLYVCTATVEGQVRQTAIEFEPKVKELCSKHPEMGVCQYEREACRASGGRVHTAAGVEITKQTEAEYDKKVMRVRFRAG